MINAEDIERLLGEDDYDIITPEEYLFRYSLTEEYARFHVKEDWNVMLDVLAEHFPEYESVAQEVFSSNAFYPFNMFMAKKKLCDEYCEWLFTILKSVEERVDSRTGQQERDVYQRRYLGFLSERLLALYIKKNGLRTYTCPVDEMQHRSLAFHVKNTIGQRVWNPLVFSLRRNR